MSWEEAITQLRAIVVEPGKAPDKAKRAADVIRVAGGFRWVGIYSVDSNQGMVHNIAWSGPCAPAFPDFAITQGLTSIAVAERRIVNTGDVASDPDYLTAFDSTRSEIIIPIIDLDSDAVAGTLDVESEQLNAFDEQTQSALDRCGQTLRTLYASPREKWEWSAAEIRRVGYKVVDAIADHISSLPSGPVFQPFPQDAAAALLAQTPLPEGRNPDQILEMFQTTIAPYPFGNGHPRFFGWVNSPPAVMGIFADALAAAMNPSCAGGNHAAIYLEKQVVGWFRDLIGFPPDSGGLLVSGASMAALTALAVARHVKCGFDIRLKGLQGDHARLIFYRSAEGHSCHQKAIELLGIGAENLRTIPCDERRRMLPSALHEAIEQVLKSGHIPVAAIASAGMVNTGAIDPLDEIADVCAEHNVWLHVDGAYGAPAILSRQYQRALTAIARADSLALDPHKWMYVPVEAGLVFIRDPQAQRSAFSLVPPYIQTDGNSGGVLGPPWFSEYGFQQTRGFRALKVWMCLQHHGWAGYRSAIERNIELAELLAEKLRASARFEVWEPQSLSIVCFRYTPESVRSEAELNTLNKSVLEEVQLGGKAFLSSTVMDGVFWLRACIVNFRTSAQDIATLVETVRAAGIECQRRG